MHLPPPPPRPPSFYIFTLIHLASLHFQSYPVTLRPKCHRAILFSILNNFMHTPSLHGNVSFCSWSHYETLQCYCSFFCFVFFFSCLYLYYHYYTTDVTITPLRAILTLLALRYLHRIRFNTYATYDTRHYIIY